MGRSVEFIRLHARRSFYQNHMYDAISGQRFNYPLLFPAISRGYHTYYLLQNSLGDVGIEL